MHKLILIIALACSFIACSKEAKDEFVASTPPMGWNSWSYFGKHTINESIIKECMDAMVEKGLAKAGYNYFVIDGGWRDTVLNEDGTLKAHPVKFSKGIKPLADYAHSLGLKFGLHTVPGTHDCGGDKVGAYGIEESHIQQFIDWGIDFVKLDRCQLNLDCEGKCWTEEKIEEVYSRWRKILDQKKSDILLSVSAYKFRTWNTEVSNMSRTTGDISCKITKGAYFTEEERSKQKHHFFSVVGIAEINNQSAPYAKPGYWNDPDVLVIGGHGLDHYEQQTHFALWCIMSSPLFLSNDPRSISKEDIDILTNEKAIQINQDNTEQGIKIASINGIDYWKKNLADGSCALLCFNRTLNNTLSFEIDLEELGIKIPNEVVDVYEGNTHKYSNNLQYTLTPHECKFLRLNK